MSEDIYDNASAQFNDEDSVIHSEYGSESFMDEDDMYGQLPGSRKRKRGPEVSILEQQHTLYADNLLDYFMLSEAGQGFTLEPPVPPEGFQIDRAIDDQGHTALHWGAAMGDLGTIKLFIKRGAKIDVRNERGETPLIRAVLFTNNFERNMMPTLVKILQITITDRDNWGATIFHHVAMTTKSQSRKKCARYYLRVLLSTLRDSWSHDDFQKFLGIRDNNGDTALHIVARHNAKKCVKLLVGYGVAGDIMNNNGETADKILRAQVQRMDDTNLASSSPLQPSAALPNGHAASSASKALSFPNSSQYQTQTAQEFSASLEPIVLTKGTQLVLAYESEIGEKNDALNESTRLLQHAMDERQQVHAKTLDLAMDDPGEGDYERSRLAEQKAALEAENESFLEQEQHQRLHHEVAACERNVPPHKINGVSNSHSSLDIDDKTAAAYALAAEQERRRELSREVGAAQALAGMTDKGEVFVRLVASSTGIEKDEVPGIVPDVLEEMERTRAEGSRLSNSAVFV